MGGTIKKEVDARMVLEFVVISSEIKIKSETEKTMNELMNKGLTMTSVDVVEMINQFRELEGNKVELMHSDLMKKIRREIEQVQEFGIDGGNISLVDYKDGKGEMRPCYSMDRDTIISLTVTESFLVRRKTIEYINKLESSIDDKTLQIVGSLSKQLEEVKQYYRLPHLEKLNFNKRIKSQLGHEMTEFEVSDVKQYVFLALGIEKWEDLPFGQRVEVLDLIDKRCKILKSQRIDLFNWND